MSQGYRTDVEITTEQEITDSDFKHIMGIVKDCEDKGFNGGCWDIDRGPNGICFVIGNTKENDKTCRLISEYLYDKGHEFELSSYEWVSTDNGEWYDRETIKDEREDN